MNNEILTILEYIERERGISRDLMVKALESAILSASRKSIHPASDLRVEIDPDTGSIKVIARLEVVDHLPNSDQLNIARARERFPVVKAGDIVDWEVTPSNFGRIAAQSAKQAIMQQLKMAEKARVSEEFSDRIGSILNGTVKKFENGATVIDFGRAEGIMSGRDRIPGEQYMVGDHINALLIAVDVAGNGPSLVVSRAANDFVKRLFAREVTEIHDGVVEIMGISREAGSRTKISVKSNDPRVDPVGSCVGMRGMRVRSITTELGGEHIDIVPFDEDIRKYVANALSPAKILSVDVDENKHVLTVKVSEDQSKLAFGKKAQNVRLASKLIGWNINIKQNESNHSVGNSIEEKILKAATELGNALNVDSGTAEILVRNGFVTVDGIRAADRESLLAIEGLDQEKLAAALDNLD